MGADVVVSRWFWGADAEQAGSRTRAMLGRARSSFARLCCSRRTHLLLMLVLLQHARLGVAMLLGAYHQLMLSKMEARGVHTWVVARAFRVIQSEWTKYEKLDVMGSIHGLPPEHDGRRKSVTYERILKSIARRG